MNDSGKGTYSQASRTATQTGEPDIAALPSHSPAPPSDPRPPMQSGDLVFVPPLISSLTTLLRLRGRNVSYNQLMAGLPGGLGTVSTAACLRSAAAVGLYGQTLPRRKITDILPGALPCILLLNPDSEGQERSCVITRIDKEIVPESGQSARENTGRTGRVEVIFPETAPGSVNLSIAELEADYSGLAFFASVTPKPDKRVEGLHLVKSKRWFWDVLFHYMPIYRDVGLASLVVNLLTLASPLFIMNVYDRVVPNNAIDTLWVLALGLVIANLMDFLLRNLRGHYVDLAGRNADVVLASRLMDKVLDIRLDAKPESTGAMANNLREFEQLREFFGSTVLLSFIDLPFLLLFIILVLHIGGPMALLPILALPLMFGFGALLQIPFEKAAERQFKHGMQKNALLVEIISGLETVKGCLAQGHMRRLWERVVDASAEESNKTRRLSNLAMSGSLFITYLINAAVVVWGVYRISDGLMTQGGLIACVILVSRALGPLMQIAGMLTQLQKSRMALKALDKLMALPAEHDETREYDFGQLAPSFRLEGVNFNYPTPDNPEAQTIPALRDINIQINPGERVAFIGHTGSGKSTLSRLLIGLYQPTSGSVKFGGVDIRQLDPVDLRSQVGFMPQDNYLFYGSVRDNIAMGFPLADDAKIVQAAAIAGVTDFVRNHPAGFAMQVGERGTALSGGQRQAVALARALIRAPRVLILDEPSSNLDMPSEKALTARLQANLYGCTLLLMTHRPSLLALVDRVVVLHNGAIIADGPRDLILRAMENGQIRPQNPQKAGRS